MISAWHLLWIIPTCTAIGMVLMALLVSSHNDEFEDGDDH